MRRLELEVQDEVADKGLLLALRGENVGRIVRRTAQEIRRKDHGQVIDGHLCHSLILHDMGKDKKKNW